MSSPITTHILDLSRGLPARGVSVILSIQASDGVWNELARGVTDADGRLRDLLSAKTSLTPASYRLLFDTASYFQAIGVPTFYPEVVVTFLVDDSSAHYHVPLLLSPFGYSTYRGT